MKNENDEKESLSETARRRAKEAARKRARTLVETNEHFSLLLDLRDRRIRGLEERLARAGRKRGGLRLLVIDDDPAMPGLMNACLADAPWEAVCIRGSEVLNVSEVYDMIIIDASAALKPYADGLDLCRLLFESGYGRGFVLMASRSDDRLTRFVRDADLPLLLKPFLRDELLELLQERGKSISNERKNS